MPPGLRFNPPMWLPHRRCKPNILIVNQQAAKKNYSQPVPSLISPKGESLGKPAGFMSNVEDPASLPLSSTLLLSTCLVSSRTSHRSGRRRSRRCRSGCLRSGRLRQDWLPAAGLAIAPPSALAFFWQRRTLDLEMCRSAAVSFTLLPPFMSSITLEQSTLCLAAARPTPEASRQASRPPQTRQLPP